MILSNALSIFAIAISLGTFFFTAYEQYWKKPVLSLVLGDRISLSYGPDYAGITLWACVVLANQGAEDAVILSIEGTLAQAGGGWRSELTWLGLGKYQDQATPGQPFQPLFAFVDWAEALVSSSRKAATNWISFTGPIPGRLPPGSYSLRLSVVTQGKRHRLSSRGSNARTRSGTACSWTGSFEIAADGTGHLEEHRVGTADGMVPGAYTVHLAGETMRLPLASLTAAPGPNPQAQPDPRA
jgi:hypothetical protein